jgi:hypothetical protein
VAKPKYIQPLGTAAKVRLAIVTGSGFGKTVFSGTAPKALFLTTDKEGTMSAKKHGSTADEWKINSWEDPGGLEDAYQYMLHEGCKEYDWLIHDNATEEQNLGMEKAMEVALLKAPSRNPYVPDKREYQISQNGFIAITKKFIDLPVHQIWTVHRKWFDPDNGEEGFWSANIQGGQGAIAEQFLGYMNMIGHGEVKKNAKGETVRRLYFDHYLTYRGKDRYDAMGRSRDNLTVPRMMELIQGKATPRTTRRTVRKATSAA